VNGTCGMSLNVIPSHETNIDRTRGFASSGARFYPKVTIMATGTVKWFNPAKGYGFIQPEDGGKDVFVHISALQRAGIASVAEGQKVEYELAAGRDGRSSAENLKLAE
jgi:CspA family cold shock protein